MPIRGILSKIKNLIAYSRSRISVHFDDSIYYMFSGYKAKIINFIDILHYLFNLKSNTIQIGSRIVEIPFLYKNFNFKECKNVLDVGCLGSKISLQLSSLGYDVTGIDYRHNPINYKPVKFIKGDLIKEDIPLESFDCVICISVVEHIGLPAYKIPPFENGDMKAVEKIYKILKRGGKLILTVPFGRGIINNFEREYDNASLRKLLSKFKIETLEIYEKRDNFWVLSSDYTNDYEKVACVSCIKD